MTIPKHFQITHYQFLLVLVLVSCSPFPLKIVGVIWPYRLALVGSWNIGMAFSDVDYGHKCVLARSFLLTCELNIWQMSRHDILSEASCRTATTCGVGNTPRPNGIVGFYNRFNESLLLAVFLCGRHRIVLMTF